MSSAAETTIRPLRPDDRADVAAATIVGRRALASQYPGEFDGAPDARQLARTAHAARTTPEGAWVAEADGRVVGVALALLRERLWILSLLGVDPDLHAAGVGRRLLEATWAPVTEGRADGGLITASSSPGALRRYRRLGFDLHASLAASGPVARVTIPTGLRSRPADLGRDVERMDAVSRALRGAGHGPDLRFLAEWGSRLVVCGDDGWGAAREGAVVVAAGRDEATARDVLWSLLAGAAPGETVEVLWLTGAQQWAIDVCLDAGLLLSPEGPVCTWGRVGPMAPYLPSGAWL